MQVRFAIDHDLRREEFVERAQFFPVVFTLDVEPHQLSQAAREALALCNPDLPDVFELRSPLAGAGPDTETGRLWAILVNPNAYTVPEVVEMWTKEFLAARSTKNDDKNDDDWEPTFD